MTDDDKNDDKNNLREISVRELLNVLIDLEDNKLMFKDVPQIVNRGAVMAHMHQFDPGNVRAHGYVDIKNEDTARSRIKCPIYANNDNKKIIFNNYLCSCGLLFIFPGEVQAPEYEYLIPYRGMGVCPCTTCVHWKAIISKCMY